MQGKRCMVRVAGGLLLAVTEADQASICRPREVAMAMAMAMAMVSMVLMVDESTD